MALHRQPALRRGLLLAGMPRRVDPLNGEGISYALERPDGGETAADALARREGPAREPVARRYPDRLRAAYGGATRSASASSRCSAARTWSGSPPRTA